MSAPIRALIVDDEPLARRGICARLPAPEFVVADECATGRAAIESIRSLAVDLVFLDVQMPDIDGFGVIEAIGAAHMPMTIFVTAFDAYAVRAFESHAIDYLLKPINDARFASTLLRARARLHEREAGSLATQYAAALAQLALTANALQPRLSVRDRGRTVLLDPGDVDWVTADGDYVRIASGTRTFLMRETLTAMSERLTAPRFLRIHRSTIVNVEHIRELAPLPNRDYVVVMRDGTRLRASRTYDDAMAELLGSQSARAILHVRGVR